MRFGVWFKKKKRDKFKWRTVLFFDFNHFFFFTLKIFLIPIEFMLGEFKTKKKLKVKII